MNSKWSWIHKELLWCALGVYLGVDDKRDFAYIFDL